MPFAKHMASLKLLRAHPGAQANVCFNPLFLFLYLVSTLSTFSQWNPAERTSLCLIYHDYAYSSSALPQNKSPIELLFIIEYTIRLLFRKFCKYSYHHHFFRRQRDIAYTSYNSMRQFYMR